MTQGKTLQQLWEENGEKPIKVFCSDWAESNGPFLVQARSPTGIFVGWFDNGAGCYEGGDCLGWRLYQEPKPKNKLYAYIRFNTLSDPYLCFLKQEITNEKFKEAYKIWKRVPQFDCEVEE